MTDFRADFAPLDSAFEAFDAQLTDAPSSVPQADPLASAQFTPSILKLVRRKIATHSNGIPLQYENAWHWAGDWVKQHGVTLPPDTNELRSLRNWFCYQVNMHKKGTVSAGSKRLLAQYGVDLSLYRAPKTGRGFRMDDAALIESLRQHHARHGSYDLSDDADPQLLEWQRRLLYSFGERGMTKRMRHIASELPGLHFGLWRRPNDRDLSPFAMAWWREAQTFRARTQDTPAFRGAIDPRTPAAQRAWASEQLTARAYGHLSKRQEGELFSLGLIAKPDTRRSNLHEAAMRMVREVEGQERDNGMIERDLKHFLGVALMVRLLHRQAPLTEIYASLSITPGEFARSQEALSTLKLSWSHAHTKLLAATRMTYKKNQLIFDEAVDGDDIPPEIYSDIPRRLRGPVRELASQILVARDVLNAISIRQRLVSSESLVH